MTVNGTPDFNDLDGGVIVAILCMFNVNERAPVGAAFQFFHIQCDIIQC